MVCLFISPSVPLRPLVGLRPSSNSFILSFCLTIPTVSHSATVENTTPEGVLSQCGCHETSDQSHSSQRYMAWCGCHEILIPCSATVLTSPPFPTDFYFSRCAWVHTTPFHSSGSNFWRLQFVFRSYLWTFPLPSIWKFWLPEDCSWSGQKTSSG